MILFVENNTNFLVYAEIAKYITEAHGLDCCILTLSKKKTLYIKKLGIQSVFLGDIKAHEGICFEKIIETIEDRNDSFTIAQYLNQDRHLKHYSYEKSHDLLKKYSELFYSFLLKENISLIVGELTWANELLFMHISKSLFKITYVDLLNNYVFERPRLTFFDDKHTAKYLDLVADTVTIKTKFDLVSYRENRKLLNMSTIFNSFSNYPLSKYIEKYKLLKDFGDSFDYKYDKKLKIFFNINKKWNMFWNNLLGSYIFDELDKNDCYYYYPLHIQPEATPDIVAPFYNNQLEIIEKISYSLPLGTFLYVKDHPDGLGYRGLKYYKKIKENKRVKLINYNISSRHLIEKSLGVITIAGTAAIEARIMDKPVILFSDIFFSTKVDHIYSIRDYNDIPVLLKRFKKDSLLFKSINLERFLMYLNSASAEGYIYDPIIQPSVLDKSNIKNNGDFIVSFLGLQ